MRASNVAVFALVPLLMVVRAQTPTEYAIINELPSCALGCLASNILGSSCVESDVACFCKNKSFLTLLQTCVVRDCIAADVATSHNLFLELCSSAGVTISGTVEASTTTGGAMGNEPAPTASADANASLSVLVVTTTASGGAPTTVFQIVPVNTVEAITGSSNSGSNANSNQSSNQPSDGLSQGAKIGMGVGIPVAVIGIALAVFFFCWRRRRQQKTDTEGVAAAIPPAAPEMSNDTSGTHELRGDGKAFLVTDTKAPYDERKELDTAYIPPVREEIYKSPVPYAGQGNSDLSPASQIHTFNISPSSLPSGLHKYNASPSPLPSELQNPAYYVPPSTLPPEMHTASNTAELSGFQNVGSSYEYFVPSELSSDPASHPVGHSLGSSVALTGISAASAVGVGVNQEEEEAKLVLLRDRMERIREDKERLEQIQRLKDLERETQREILESQRRTTGS